MQIQILHVGFEPAGGRATYRLTPTTNSLSGIATFEGEADFAVRQGTRPLTLDDSELVVVGGGTGALFVLVAFLSLVGPRGEPEPKPETYRRSVARLLANMAVSAQLDCFSTLPRVVLDAR